jgi:hypothetical protein
MVWDYRWYWRRNGQIENQFGSGGYKGDSFRGKTDTNVLTEAQLPIKSQQIQLAFLIRVLKIQTMEP